MSRWGFSLRAIGAWLAAGIVAGAVWALALGGLNVWADPREAADFITPQTRLVPLMSIVLLLFGLVLLPIVSALGHWLKLARPWADCIALALACAAITLGGVIQVSLDNAEGRLAPTDHPAAFLTAYVVAPVAGALMGLIYWRLANPSRIGA